MDNTVKIVSLLVLLVLGVAVCISYSIVQWNKIRANKEIECLKNWGTMMQMVGRYSELACQKHNINN